MSASQPAPANRAVFLSYASQDAEVVERIAVALRAAGVEVWFDKSELTGGDAWDAKIRGQIKSCALFVPIISANTNARREGYFRREWKLAVDRTYDMWGPTGSTCWLLQSSRERGSNRRCGAHPERLGDP